MKARIVGAKPMSREEAKAYVRERMGKGVRSGAAYVVRQLRVVVGVQAPRVRTRSGWRATVKATPGAPPRRVSGKGQQSVNARFTSKNVVFSAVWYMLWLEKHGHPWLEKTVRRLVNDFVRIVNGRSA